MLSMFRKSAPAAAAQPSSGGLKTPAAAMPVDPAYRKMFERHAAWLMKEQGGACADFSKASLSGIQWQGVNLAQANFRSSSLIEADLSDAILTAADLSYANLPGIILSRADLTGANLEHAKLDRAWLESANLSEVKANEASFAGACLEGARLPEAALQSCKMTELRAAKVSLQHARLFGCDLSRANLATRNPWSTSPICSMPVRGPSAMRLLSLFRSIPCASRSRAPSSSPPAR